MELTNGIDPKKTNVQLPAYLHRVSESLWKQLFHNSTLQSIHGRVRELERGAILQQWLRHA
jgi:hypothetical protein